jgi:long-chain acyl-CoA synthetase
MDGSAASMNSFWIHAAARPDELGVVEPDGTEHTKGQTLAACNQVVHGLRSLGLAKGDTIATVLPNCAPMVELALASGQSGIYITPVNWHLTALEIEFILKDSGSKVVVVHASFADAARKALAGTDLPAESRFVVGGEAEGFRPYAELKAGQPTSAPEGRAGGFAMTYTSGTWGRARKGRRRGSACGRVRGAPRPTS